MIRQKTEASPIAKKQTVLRFRTQTFTLLLDVVWPLESDSSAVDDPVSIRSMACLLTYKRSELSQSLFTSTFPPLPKRALLAHRVIPIFSLPPV